MTEEQEEAMKLFKDTYKNYNIKTLEIKEVE